MNNPPASAPSTDPSRNMYWRRARHLTMTLLAIWFAGTFSIIFFARELSSISLFGWTLSFYLAAQGAVLFFTLLIGIHTYKMNKLDEDTEKNNDVE